jgi:hypothetical protein
MVRCIRRYFDNRQKRQHLMKRKNDFPDRQRANQFLVSDRGKEETA